MKIHYTLGLLVSMLTGVGIGAVAVQSLHAQAKPPVYYVTEIDTSNLDSYLKDYAPLAQKTIKDNGGRIIAGKLASAPVALLFGSEKFGLSNEDMSHCHWLMRIPTRDDHGSMNLGQAVAVCLYELARGGKVVGAKRSGDGDRAAAGELERLTQLLFDLLNASGYVKPRVAAATEEKLRRMARRMNLSVADADTWLGMLRQIQWKLRRNDPGSYPL